MSWGRVYEVALGAGGSLVTPGGRFFKLITASNDVDVEFFSDGGEPLAKFEGVKAGLKVDIQKFYQGADPLVGFGKVKITSAGAQTVACIVSRQPIDYDNVSTTVDIVKGAGASDTADQAIANGATVTIPANTGRRALVIYAHPSNTGNLRTGPAAAAARGRILQPGIEHVWDVTAAIKVHNDSGGSQTFGYAEETD